MWHFNKVQLSVEHVAKILMFQKTTGYTSKHLGLQIMSKQES